MRISGSEAFSVLAVGSNSNEKALGNLLQTYWTRFQGAQISRALGM